MDAQGEFENLIKKGDWTQTYVLWDDSANLYTTLPAKKYPPFFRRSNLLPISWFSEDTDLKMCKNSRNWGW